MNSDAVREAHDFKFFLAVLEWLANAPFAWTLFWCLFINLGMVFLLGAVVETRLVPLRLGRQVYGFWPGSIGQAVAVAALLKATQYVVVPHWFDGWILQLAIFALGVFLAIRKHRQEAHKDLYEPRAWRMPTKRYRNLVLRPVFAFPLVMSAIVCGWTLVSMLVTWLTSSTPFTEVLTSPLVLWLAVATLGELFWFVLHRMDGRMTREELRRRLDWLHPYDYEFPWQRLRRRR